MKAVTSKDGTNIAFDQMGQGPALILVGGALAVRSHPMVTELVEILAPHFTVFNYDRRGRGDSGNTLPYAVEREVEDIIDDLFDAEMKPPEWVEMEKVAHTLAYDGTIMGNTMSGKPLPPKRWASATSPTLVIAGGNEDTGVTHLRFNVIK